MSAHPDVTTDPTAWLARTTPARLFTGRAGSSHRTAAQLALRADHAGARDAVAAQLELERPDMADLVERYRIPVVSSRASTRAEFLRRPDLGRRLSPEARAAVLEHRSPGADVQLAIGDGLSATAVHRQVPGLLPRLLDGCAERGWSTGRPIAIRQCRVGVMNELGDLLRPRVVVLLIGERPGLATAESLSAYLAFQPRTGHTDADRNLVSNIHTAGVPLPEAAHRILALTGALMEAGRSGVSVKEPLDETPDSLPAAGFSA